MHDEGMPVGRERIRKSLERQGLRPVYRRPYRVTTDSDHDTPLSPNLLERRFDESKAAREREAALKN